MDFSNELEHLKNSYSALSGWDSRLDTTMVSVFSFSTEIILLSSLRRASDIIIERVSGCRFGNNNALRQYGSIIKELADKRVIPSTVYDAALSIERIYLRNKHLSEIGSTDVVSAISSFIEIIDWISKAPNRRKTGTDVENPFLNRSAIINPDYFIGREPLIKKIFDRISSEKPQSISIYGERRIGKSSILAYINHPSVQAKFLKDQQRYLFTYIDFQRYVQTNPVIFFEVLLTNLYRDSRQPIPVINAENCYREFENFVVRCTKEKIKIILSFDEFEKITKNNSFGLEFYSFLRSMANNQDIAYITASYTVLEKLCYSKQISDSPFFNIFTAYRIRKFTDDESSLLIRHYLQLSGMSFDFSSFNDQIMAETGNLPIFLQIYCSILFERVNREKSAQPDDLSEEYLEETAAHFSFIWETMSDQEKKLIGKIVVNEPIKDKDSFILRELVEKGYVRKTGDNPILFSRSFHNFLINEKNITDSAEKSGVVENQEPKTQQELGSPGIQDYRHQIRTILVKGGIAILGLVILIGAVRLFFPEFTFPDVKKPEHEKVKFGKPEMTRGAIFIADSNTRDTIKIGKYYALIIGVQKYRSPVVQNLDQPLKDANDIKDILLKDYSFEPQNLYFLSNPTRDHIIDTLELLQNKVTSGDFLLFFYAGHGIYDSLKQRGYWLPSDADDKNPANMISNSEIRDYLNSIRARHILLIVDACFAGSIFKSAGATDTVPFDAYTLNKLQAKSRKAITSGYREEVPDKSIFLRFLIESLRENDHKHYFTASDLFNWTTQKYSDYFKRNISPRGIKNPQYSTVPTDQDGSGGDEGGEFIFIRLNPR